MDAAKTARDWRSAMTMALVAGLLLVVQPQARAQGVAMVTDVLGRASGTVPIAISSELPADARGRLETGATLVVIYLASGVEYTFTGPARILFADAAPQVLAGPEPRKRSSPLAELGNVRIRPLEVTPGNFVMRSLPRSLARIRLLNLSGTRTLDSEPEFRWEAAGADTTYRFELSDETGRLLHEADVTGESFRLPAAVRLGEGLGYTWQLSARLPDGRRYTSAGDFTIATADLRGQARRLRPAETAPVTERVAYAAWLEQGGLKDEARKYWKALAAERPEDARLKALAEE